MKHVSSVLLFLLLMTGAAAMADDPRQEQRKEAHQHLDRLEERLNAAMDGKRVKTSQEIALEAQVQRLEEQVAHLTEQLSKCEED